MTPKKTREAILAAIGAGKTHVWEIAEYADVGHRLTNDILVKLCNAGAIRRTRQGQYGPVPGQTYPIIVKPVVTIGDWPLVRL